MKGREKAYEGYKPRARYDVVWCLLTRGEGIRDRLLNSKGWELNILVDLPRPRIHALPGHPHPRLDECNIGLHRGLLSSVLRLTRTDRGFLRLGFKLWFTYLVTHSVRYDS